jgi:hypothetical protein
MAEEPMLLLMHCKTRIYWRAPAANPRFAQGKPLRRKRKGCAGAPVPEPICPPGLLALPIEQAGDFGHSNPPAVCSRIPASRADWCAFSPAQCAFPSALGLKVFENLVCASTAGSSRGSAPTASSPGVFLDGSWRAPAARSRSSPGVFAVG